MVTKTAVSEKGNDSMPKPKKPYPPKGAMLSSSCFNGDKYMQIADGKGKSSNQLYEAKSADCN